MNIASSKYLIEGSAIKDDIYINADTVDDETSEENDYVDNTKGVSKLNENSAKSLMMSVPQVKSHKLLTDASNNLSLRLMGMLDVNKTNMKHHKFDVVASKAYTLDRSLPGDITQGTHYFKRRGLSVSAGGYQEAMQNTALP